MRAEVIGSGAVHLGVLVVLFAVRSAAPIVVPGPDVVQVALLDLPPATATPRVVTPPPAPEPAREERTIKPLDESGVKLVKPKPKPRAKPEEEAATPPAPAPALPYAAVGPAGLSGQVAVDVRDFEFTYYLVLVRNRIAQNWTPPGGIPGSGVRCVVAFRIGRTGDIRGAQLETGSGNAYFDRSALRAVMVSDPLPPLPLGFGGQDLGVHFGFQYATP